MPILCFPDIVCTFSPNDMCGNLLREATLLTWDEAPMAHKDAFEAQKCSLSK